MCVDIISYLLKIRSVLKIYVSLIVRETSAFVLNRVDLLTPINNIEPEYIQRISMGIDICLLN